MGKFSLHLWYNHHFQSIISPNVFNGNTKAYSFPAFTGCRGGKHLVLPLRLWEFSHYLSMFSWILADNPEEYHTHL